MPKKKAGRPSKGVLARSRPILVRLDRQLVAQVDRLADRRELATGSSVTRHDLIREAIESYMARQNL